MRRGIGRGRTTCDKSIDEDEPIAKSSFAATIDTELLSEKIQKMAIGRGKKSDKGNMSVHHTSAASSDTLNCKNRILSTARHNGARSLFNKPSPLSENQQQKKKVPLEVNVALILQMISQSRNSTNFLDRRVLNN